MPKKKKLYLYDDDGLSFDYVINKLNDIFGWSVYQSEQIALIVHYNGKAVLKEGELKKLEEFKKELDKTKLLTEIF